MSIGAPKGNKNAEGNSKYKKEYNDLAYKYCLLGADDKRLAENFDVTETTINNWKIQFPLFFESIKNGKDVADAEIANSLYQTAKGYERDEEEVKVVSMGNGAGSEAVKIPIKKYYPPVPVSGFFWLKNRQSKNWRDKVEIDNKYIPEPLIIKSEDGKVIKIEYTVKDGSKNEGNNSRE
jgi:hypothetical protein